MDTRIATVVIDASAFSSTNLRIKYTFINILTLLSFRIEAFALGARRALRSGEFSISSTFLLLWTIFVTNASATFFVRIIRAIHVAVTDGAFIYALIVSVAHEEFLRFSEAEVWKFSFSRALAGNQDRLDSDYGQD